MSKKKETEEPNENQHPMYVFDCPLLGLETKGSMIVACGGGGSAKSGLKNKAVCLSFCASKKKANINLFYNPNKKYLWEWYETEGKMKKRGCFQLDSFPFECLNFNPKESQVVLGASDTVYLLPYQPTLVRTPTCSHSNTDISFFQWISRPRLQKSSERVL